MFGPESGRGSWSGLPFVFEKVRVKDSKRCQERCRRFLEVFEKEVKGEGRSFSPANIDNFLLSLKGLQNGGNVLPGT